MQAVAWLVGREAGEQVAQQVLLLGAECSEQFGFGVVAGTGHAGLGPPSGCGDLGDAGSAVVRVEGADDQSAGFQASDRKHQAISGHMQPRSVRPDGMSGHIR